MSRSGFEERSVGELRDRARELEIEGRSAMSKDELIAALREHAK
jgi:23S rRNA C2498 (ribose-2'-O)-methylase RlmM